MLGVATLSFAGASASRRQLSVNSPAAPDHSGRTAMKYVVPAVAPNRPGSIQFPPATRSVRPVPAYTATVGRSPWPGTAVSKTNVPVDGAVQRYQTAGSESGGQPGSGVAASVVPVTLPLSPASGWAFAKSSFAGGSRQRSRNAPATPPWTSTAIR